MAMLCERPGCSEPSAVLFGFNAIDLRVWLEAPETAEDLDEFTALCARHADSLVVPRGWVLDDRRETVPRLFRPPAPRRPPSDESPAASGDASGPTRRSARSADVGDDVHVADLPTQLSFDDSATVERITERRTPRPDGDEPDPDETLALPWTPVYDEDDDLDGLLDADGELLARAFRGEDRRRPGTL